jgi:hypothetical protein
VPRRSIIKGCFRTPTLICFVFEVFLPFAVFLSGLSVNHKISVRIWIYWFLDINSDHFPVWVMYAVCSIMVRYCHAICEPIVWIMREPRHVTTLWTSRPVTAIACGTWRFITVFTRDLPLFPIIQIWRVAANVLNKQSRTADKWWSSSLGLGVGLQTHLILFTKYRKGALTLTDSLSMRLTSVNLFIYYYYLQHSLVGSGFY